MCYTFFRKDLFIFRGGKGGKHRCERETSNACPSDAPGQGTKPTTQSCALTGNRTGNLLLFRMTSNQLRQARQGRAILSMTTAQFVYTSIITNT